MLFYHMLFWCSAGSPINVLPNNISPNNVSPNSPPQALGGSQMPYQSPWLGLVRLGWGRLG
jgi:hypothetical protein